MKLLFVFGALFSYILSGINPAVIISKVVYKTDIRKSGSKNPGFTNFRRVFGGKWAYVVLFIDIFKSLSMTLIFGYLFEKAGLDRAFGAAYSGFFATVGHVFPVWYKFKGGKGFLVCISSIWVVSPLTGLFATIVMALVLFLTRYMSLADICAVISAPLFMLLFGIGGYSLLFVCMGSALVVIRHKDNIKRLIHGKESKII